MMSVRETSEIWGIFDTRITKMCHEDKIKGTVKNGKSKEYILVVFLAFLYIT